jgi:DNA-binding GntR family transcriptional regulator
LSHQVILETLVARDSIGTRIKQILLERIVDGTYKPGQRLKELQIAREFHTSQSPVREALRELEAVGLIETKYYQGSRVRSSSLSELAQAYEIRAVLEELAAHTAAFALKSRTESLKKTLDKAISLSKKGHWRLYTRYNYLFHRSVVEASQNALLLQVWESLHFEFRTRLSIEKTASSNRNAFHFESTARDHYEILDALHSGNGQRAGQLLREHSLRCASVIRASQSDSPSAPIFAELGDTKLSELSAR